MTIFGTLVGWLGSWKLPFQWMIWGYLYDSGKRPISKSRDIDFRMLHRF